MDRRDRTITRLKLRISQLEVESAEQEQSLNRLRRTLTRTEHRLQEISATALRTQYPNFGVMYTHYLEYLRRARTVGTQATEPALQIPFKLRNIALAQSHNVATPEVYRVWQTLNEIDLDGLPDEFVLKADGGAGGHAVLPLRRTAKGYERLGGNDTFTLHELQQFFDNLGNRARPPFFAEELLRQNSVDGPVPDDVKVYTFYGEPAQVLLMRVPDPSRRHRSVTQRYIDPTTGTGLGNVASDSNYDPNIPAPTYLDEIIEVASHLSRATGLSFCRVDFYDTPNGPIFGEITRAPGGVPIYAHDHDAGMGNLWLDAKVRLNADLARGRPQGILWGEQPHQWHYEESHRAAAYARPVVACSQWCFAN